MTSRPYRLLSRVPDVLAPTFTAYRLGPSRQRNPAAWRRQSLRDAQQHRFASTWRCADIGETVAPVALPPVHRGHDSNSSSCVREIATSVSYACRPITFSVVVAIIHLGVLRWIFLPIGG
jgi:hypothetical protein